MKEQYIPQTELQNGHETEYILVERSEYEKMQGVAFDREEGDPYSLSKMPTREELQDFLRGNSSHPVTVMYNLLTGEFMRIAPSPVKSSQEDNVRPISDYSFSE